MAEQNNTQVGAVGPPWELLGKFVLVVLYLGSVASALAMGALLFTGFVGIYGGIYTGITAGLHSLGGANSATWSELAAHQVITGVEMLLLAPLAYLVLVNLARYVQTWMTRKDDERAKAKLLGVKALVVGLLIAMVATDLVGKVLEDGLDAQSLYECLAIGVLTLYCFGLEWISAKILKVHPSQPAAKPEGSNAHGATVEKG